MLGRFLELSLPTLDIRESLNFYRTIGFSEAAVGEAWRHPYAVVTDGRIHVGLHQNPAFEPSITFVKADLLKHLDEFAALAPRFEFRYLGNDVFNQVGWLDPAGTLVRVLEARTFSPSKRRPVDSSACGYFVEIALPMPERDSGKDYWERLGFVGMDAFDAPLPHVACTSDTIDIGLYDRALMLKPGLMFEAVDFAQARRTLEQLNIGSSRRLPAPLDARSTAIWVAPEGTSLWMSQGPADALA